MLGKQSRRDPGEFEIEPGTVDIREVLAVLDGKLPSEVGLVTGSAHNFSFPVWHMQKARPLQVSVTSFTGVGQVMSFAANFAAGGDMNNVKPGLEYLGKLHKAGSVLRVLGTTPYAQFVKGEIPIWISYENDGLKAKITDGLGDAVAVVIPKEASAAAPYGISLVEKGPNPNAGKLWLNFIMSDFGQGIFAEGFVRPSVPGIVLPASVADKLPTAPQVRPLDVRAAAAKKAEIDQGYVTATGAR